MEVIKDEQIWNTLEQHWEQAHGEKDFGDTYSLEDAQVVAQAQLDAIRAELDKEYDKPDSEGWWWYKFAGISEPMYFSADEIKTKTEWFEKNFKGKWYKAYVPGGEK